MKPRHLTSSYSLLSMVAVSCMQHQGANSVSFMQYCRHIETVFAPRYGRRVVRAPSWPPCGPTGSRFARQHGRFAARRVARAPHKSLLLGLSEAKTFKSLLTIRPIGRGGRGLVLGSVLLDKDASEKLKSKTESRYPKPKYTSPACCGSSTLIR
jgi:hypothetical protein